MKQAKVNENGKNEKAVKHQKTPEERKKTVLRWIVDIITIFLGSTVYSIGLHSFSVPNDIVAGGVGGIATLTVRYYKRAAYNSRLYFSR